MTQNYQDNHLISKGRIGYNEFSMATIDPSGLGISLDKLIERSEDTADDDEGNGPGTFYYHLLDFKPIFKI